MMPDEYGPEVPEEADIVDAPQGPPTANAWSWTSTNLIIAAVSVATIGFAVYFIMAYTGAKSRAMELAKEASNGAGS